MNQLAAVGSAVRLPDRERHEVVQVLQDGLIEGRLSSNTFGWRLHAALRARNRSELRQLVSDLPPRDWPDRALRWLGRLGALLRLARPGPPETLLLPVPETEAFTIGRNRETCDLVLSGDRLVSARHADLRVVDGRWVLTDLRSTNGTWVNGARLVHSAVVGPGDRVRFGDQHFILVTGTALTPGQPGTEQLF
jgi:hypothetical protein